MTHRQQLEARYPASVGEVFGALGLTLSFRRWAADAEARIGAMPRAGYRYRFETPGLMRAGRVVDVIRPVGVTLKEILHDSPCRVGLMLRWRIEPVADGSSVRLHARYRLNHAAMLRARHWDRRLEAHFRRQLAFIAVNLDRLRDDSERTPHLRENVI